MKSLGLGYFTCENWVMGGNWTRTRVLSSYTYRCLAGTMVRWAGWGLRPPEISQLRGSHLLLSPCQWSQTELKMIQTAIGNISISLNMVPVDTVFANETFLQDSNQQLLDSRVLCFYMIRPSEPSSNWHVYQAFRRVYGPWERWSLNPSGH